MPDCWSSYHGEYFILLPLEMRVQPRVKDFDVEGYMNETMRSFNVDVSIDTSLHYWGIAVIPYEGMHHYTPLQVPPRCHN